MFCVYIYRTIRSWLNKQFINTIADDSEAANWLKHSPTYSIEGTWASSGLRNWNYPFHVLGSHSCKFSGFECIRYQTLPLTVSPYELNMQGPFTALSSLICEDYFLLFQRLYLSFSCECPCLQFGIRCQKNGTKLWNKQIAEGQWEQLSMQTIIILFFLLN